MRIGPGKACFAAVLMQCARLPGEPPPAPSVYPPHASVHGKSIQEWTGDWWQWVASIPTDRNPIEDVTGERCGTEQTRPVWFLVGYRSKSPIERTCTVPAGKEILFPILNTIWWSPGDCLPDDLDKCRVGARTTMDEVHFLYCEIDGQRVDRLDLHREESPYFPFTVPPGNLFGLDPIIAYTGVSDGFWVLLESLSPGDHVIRFQGKLGPIDDPSFQLDVTYRLKVEAHFRRGEANGDGNADLSDAVFILNFLFLGAAAPTCVDAADANDDGKLDLSDAVFFLNYLFLGGSSPPAPGPDACGGDPTMDGLPGCMGGC